jgi:excisionase family DNA binding protein
MSNDAPLVVKPAEAQSLLRCSRPFLYGLINAGHLQSFKDGRSRKISVASIHRYVEEKLKGEPPKKAALRRQRGARR